MDPSPKTGTPGEKIFIDLVNSSESIAPTFGHTRGISFAVKLSNNLQAPGQDLMLWEWWQGSPYGPPCSMIIKPGTTQWQVDLRNNTTTGDSHNPAITLDGLTLNRDQWYFFVVLVYPNYTGAGRIRVWQDGALALDHSTDPIGYDPSMPASSTGGNPLSAFYIDFGLYRPADHAVAEVYFDRIRYGDGYPALTR